VTRAISARLTELCAKMVRSTRLRLCFFVCWRVAFFMLGRFLV